MGSNKLEQVNTNYSAHKYAIRFCVLITVTDTVSLIFNNFCIYSFVVNIVKMEGPEVTFLFQFGNIRDMVQVPVSTLTLKLLKDMACDFINSKVRF